VPHLPHDIVLGATVYVELWRNTPRNRAAKQLFARASYGARGNTAGERAHLNAGDTQPVADEEFLHTYPAYSGVEIRSTLLTGRVLMVDSAQEAVAAVLGVTAAQLSDPNDWSICQRVVRDLFAHGFQALRLPSARADGSIVIVEHSAALRLLREQQIVYRTITSKSHGHKVPDP
jgi:hypothetical protein